MWRVRIYKKVLQWWSYFTLGFAGITFEYETLRDVDYSEYLGPNWKKELAERKKPISTVVSNHVAFIDLFVMIISDHTPGFTPKEESRKVPGFGKIMEGM